MNPIVKRIVNILGIAAAVGVAVLVPILSSMPTGTAWTVRLGIVLAIFSTLARAFGPATTGPVPANELDSNPKTSNVVALTPPAGTRPGTGYPGGKTLALLVLAGSLLFGGTAWAQSPPTSPQLGGCVANGEVCFGTAADVVLTKIGLSGDNKGISGGFSTGVGYGGTFAPDKFYATGLDLFLNVNLSGTSGIASRVSPAVMLHAMNYLFLGVGLDIIAPTDTVSSYGTGWSLLLGFGSTITSITPGYAKREASRQLAAERASAGK